MVWAALMFPSAAVMAAGWVKMTLWPLYELWRTPPPSDEDEEDADL